MKIFAAVLLTAMFVGPALAGPNIVGNFQGWDPADPTTEVTLQPNGVYEYTLVSAVAGSLYQYKVSETDAWDGNDFPGANQGFTPSSSTDVTFYVNLGATPGTKEGDEYVFHSLNPPIVCGSFMSELGGTDWDQTDTTLTVMDDTDGDGIWEWNSVIPTGSYQFKIVLNNTWDQDTHPPSGNYNFGSDGSTPVYFSYDMATNTTTVFSSAPPQVLFARVPADCPMDPSIIEVTFDKAMDQTSAETTTNYTVYEDGSPVTVSTATRDATSHDIVTLGMSAPLSGGSDYQVVVSGVLSESDLQPVDPNNNDACFYLQKVVFELNMGLYVDTNGLPTTVNIQGDTYPITWGVCEGCEALDDGNGDDAAAGDTTYTVTEYFSMMYDCAAAADTAQVKYKYIVDCTTWEGDFDFGHYLDLDPMVAGQTANVWWSDLSPVDNVQCDVGVRFQVANPPTCGQALYVRGSQAPLDWSTGVEMVDDGTGGDLSSGDGIYTALLTFPTGTYKYLEYKYFCAESDTTGAYECDTYPNRTLTLDDVNGCVTFRAGPMEILDLWNWCGPVTSTPEGRQTSTTWGRIKSLYAPKK